MEWVEKFTGYWVLIKDGIELATVNHQRKSFFAKSNGKEKHFDAYGFLKFQSVEMVRAKKWCEEQLTSS